MKQKVIEPQRARINKQRSRQQDWTRERAGTSERRSHSTAQLRKVKCVRARERRRNNTKQCRWAGLVSARERKPVINEERRVSELERNRE